MCSQWLSIIIPVYNSGKYLKDILDDIVNQTVFNKLEIIIVNDGSVDNSRDICEKYIKEYSNFTLYTQENSGVSVARNVGIEKSNGRYITFLDADDRIDCDLYEKMLLTIESTNADIAVVDFDMVHMNGARKKHRRILKKTIYGTDKLYMDFFSGIIGNNVVDKIFRTELVKQCRFPQGYRVGEDMYFVYCCLKNANVVTIDTGICGYHYVVRQNSAMTSIFSEKYIDAVELSKKMYDEMENHELKEYAYAHLIHERCKLLENMYKNNASNDYADIKTINQRILKKYEMKKARKYLIKRQFLGLLLMKYVPKIYMLIHSLLKIG